MLFPILIHRLFVIGFLVFSAVFGVGLGAASAPEPGAGAGAASSVTSSTVSVEGPVHRTATTPPSPDLGSSLSPTADPAADQAEPAKLVVGGATDLPLGTYSGSFELTNTGGQPTEWTWFGDPKIAVASTGGSLDPGHTVVVGFEVDPSQLGPGSNPILNCITYEGGAVDLWITVTKPGPLPTIPPSFTG